MPSTELQKQYAREHYARNRERQRQLRQAYYLANKDSMLDGMRKWRIANPERKRAIDRAWVARNPEAVKAAAKASRERRAEFFAKPAFRQREKARRASPHYKALNASNAKRRRVAARSGFDRDKVFAFYAEAQRLTAETGVPYHVDHIVPLKHRLVCGLHNEFNLRVIPAQENRVKFNKFEIE